MDAPINVGGRDGTDQTKWYTQTKSGILNLAHLITNDLTVTTGTPVAGQVLMASSSAGDVKWGTVATNGNFGGIYMIKGQNSSGDICRHLNPATNNCTCPSGYTPYIAWDWVLPNGGYYNDPGFNGSVTIWQCYKN